LPQETKSFPFNPQSPQTAPAKTGAREGLIPPLDSEAEIRAAVEMAFDYRGDVTVLLKDGRVLEGYIFDRSPAPRLDDCVLRLIPRDADDKVKVRYNELSRLSFTGRDAAAGKSFETWVKKYRQKKAAGETNIRIDPEKLE
jgi:hypothetical protein